MTSYIVFLAIGGVLAFILLIWVISLKVFGNGKDHRSDGGSGVAVGASAVCVSDSSSSGFSGGDGGGAGGC